MCLHGEFIKVLVLGGTSAILGKAGVTPQTMVNGGPLFLVSATLDLQCKAGRVVVVAGVV